MKKTNIIIIAFAALSLTGCKSLYGNYERPEVKTDGIVRDPVNDHATLEGANDFGNLPWRSVFTDPQLQTLIEKALDNNPDLLNAALNIDIAEQQLKTSKLAFLLPLPLHRQEPSPTSVRIPKQPAPIPCPSLPAGTQTSSESSVLPRKRHRCRSFRCRTTR